MSSPFRRMTMLDDGTPAYPSPRYIGKELGTLSPEKGRGPTRGLLPRLDEDGEGTHRPSKALDLGGSSEVKEEDEVQNAAQGMSVQLRPRGGWADADRESHEENEMENADDHQEGPSLEDRVPCTMEDDEDPEEWENSIRIERELTEDLVDELDEEPADNGPNEAQPEAPAATLISSSSPAVLPTNLLLKEEEDDTPLQWDAPALAQVRNADASASVTGLGLSHEGPLISPIAHVLTAPVLDEDMEGSESDSDDDDGPPVVEITSKDPMVAARAAAILKLVCQLYGCAQSTC